MRSINIDPGHAVRSADLSARWDEVLRGLEHAAEGAGALALAGDVDSLLESSTDVPVLRNWRLASALLRALAVDLSIRAAARAGSADVTADRGRLQVLLQEIDEIVDELDDEPLREEFRGAYDTAKPQVSKKALLQSLAKLPLPTLYLAKEKDRWPRRSAGNANVDAEPKIPVLRLSAFLDNTPVAATQQLRPHTLHTLRFLVRGAEWPEHATSLRVELLTTCPPTLFHVSLFETGDHSGTPQFDATLVGNIQINASQSEGASDVAVAVRAVFLMQDGSLREAPVVGHSQMRFRLSLSGEPVAPENAASPAPVTPVLPAGQFRPFQDALLSAFTRQSLRSMLRTMMDVRLDHVAGNGSLIDVVVDVIEWAEREGRVAQLVREAAAFVPGNEELQLFASEFERMQSCR